jgi:maltose alpha-D-glucosyltransferase/alpha-amylase
MPVRLLGAEQSNTSLLLGRRFLLKSLRFPPDGPNPEFEVAHFLATSTSFAHTPGLWGWGEHLGRSGAEATVALLQPFVENAGDGWAYARATLRGLVELLEREPHPPTGLEGFDARLEELAGDFLAELRGLGTITAELHLAMASHVERAAFAPEPITPADVTRWADAIEAEAQLTRELVEARHVDLPADVVPRVAALTAQASRIGEARAPLILLADGGVHKIRCHGDYHLGQVLKIADGFLIIDFEGEPSRPLAERRAKQAALRDVAGMLRSFSYAAHSVVLERPPDDRAPLWPWMERWERLARRSFRRGYLTAAQESPVRIVPVTEDDARRVAATFELEKALYEVRYELRYRPDWVRIPLAGLARLILGR